MENLDQDAFRSEFEGSQVLSDKLGWLKIVHIMLADLI